MKGVTRKTKNFCLICFTGIIALVFTFHFIVVVLYIIPFNPVVAKYNQAIHEYIEPLLTQKWELFAPDPISDNRTVFMQVKLNNQEKSEWIDISSSLIELNQNNPLTPYNRLVRVPTTGAVEAFQQDKVVSQLMEKMEEDEDDDRQHMYESLEDLSDEQRQQGVDVLYRYAFSEAQRYYSADQIDEVQLRIIIEDNVPFSERERFDEFEVEQFYVDFEWENHEYVSPAY